MVVNNRNKININGFIHDSLLIEEKDNRFCQAIFSIISDNKHLTYNFNNLFDLLLNENCGILYKINNDNYKAFGSLHFTFMQQISFNDFNNDQLSLEELKLHHDILKDIIVLPFNIHYNKLICTQTNLALCGYPDIDINSLRDKYRDRCKFYNLKLKEPYYNDIIHSTLFRFTNETDHEIFIKKYEYYLNNDIDYGYVTIDHFNIGNGTWKLNPNEIIINYKI